MKKDRYVGSFALSLKWYNKINHQPQYLLESTTMETATQQSNNATIDTERQQKAREYARKRRRLSFINMGIAALALLFILWSELNIVLRNLLQPLNWQPVPGWYPWQVLVYLLILTLGYPVITFPLAYYGGVGIPNRYWIYNMALCSW